MSAQQGSFDGFSAGISVEHNRIRCVVRNRSSIVCEVVTEFSIGEALTDGWHTADANDILSAIQRVFAKLEPGLREQITAIGLTGVGPVAVLTTDENASHYTVVSSVCNRKRASSWPGGESSDLLRMLVAFCQDNPGMLKKTRIIFDLAGFIACWLTGYPVIGEAALEQFFGGSGCNRYATMSMEAEAVISKLPKRVLRVGEIVHGVSFRSALQLGLQPDVPVILCGDAGVTSLYGSGAFKPTRRLVLVADNPLNVVMAVPAVVATIRGTWVPFAKSMPSEGTIIKGGFTNGFRGIAHALERLANGRDHAQTETALREADRTLDPDLVVLPFGGGHVQQPFPHCCLPTFLATSREPIDDLAMAAAYYRSIAYWIRMTIEDLARNGIAVDVVHLAGQAAHSWTFSQLLASIAKRIVVNFGPGCAAAGAAILATASGHGPAGSDAHSTYLMELEAEVVLGRHLYLPKSDQLDSYEAGYARYLAMVRSVKHSHVSQSSRLEESND